MNNLPISGRRTEPSGPAGPRKVSVKTDSENLRTITLWIQFWGYLSIFLLVVGVIVWIASHDGTTIT